MGLLCVQDIAVGYVYSAEGSLKMSETTCSMSVRKKGEHKKNHIYRPKRRSNEHLFTGRKTKPKYFKSMAEIHQTLGRLI